MTDKEQNKSEVDLEPTPKDGSTGMNLRGKDRRRFIKRAIIAAPFILTVASQPVWANTCSISGQMSGNLSDQNYDCGQGCSPGYWKNHEDEWMVYSPDNKYGVVFNVYPPDGIGNLTFHEVFNLCKGGVTDGHLQLAFHAVAALLNAAHPNVGFLYAPNQVIGYVQQVYNNSSSLPPGYNTVEDLKDHFDDLNNMGSCLCEDNYECCTEEYDE